MLEKFQCISVINYSFDFFLNFNFDIFFEFTFFIFFFGDKH